MSLRPISDLIDLTNSAHALAKSRSAAVLATTAQLTAQQDDAAKVAALAASLDDAQAQALAGVGPVITADGIVVEPLKGGGMNSFRPTPAKEATFDDSVLEALGVTFPDPAPPPPATGDGQPAPADTPTT